MLHSLLNRRLSKRDIKKAHHPHAIAERLAAGPRQVYLKDAIYGAIDGAVTTFAVVSGVAGAGLSIGIVLVLGLANLLADGFSMAISNYLGSRADEQLVERAREMEREHIRLVPEGEKEEVRQIYADKGFEGETLDAIVETVVADEQRWIDVMVQEEHGMSLNAGDPRMAGLVTFGAFFVAGAVPLVPFVVNWLAGEIIPSPFVVSAVLTALTFFITGALKSRIVALPWQREGFETLLVGGAAAGIAWLVGYLLRGIAV